LKRGEVFLPRHAVNNQNILLDKQPRLKLY
jgi:hypothetical protein